MSVTIEAAYAGAVEFPCNAGLSKFDSYTVAIKHNGALVMTCPAHELVAAVTKACAKVRPFTPEVA